MTTADSDKAYKAAEYRAERRSSRAILSARLDEDDRRLHRRDFGDPNKSNKDGKQYVSPEFRARAMRK